MPFSEKPPLIIVQSLDHNDNTDLGSKVASISTEEKSVSQLNSQNEKSSNTTCQMSSKVGKENIGKCFRDNKRTFDIRSIVLKARKKKICIFLFFQHTLKFIEIYFDNKCIEYWLQM